MPVQASDRMFFLPFDFVEKFKELEPPFGFNGLGYLVYMRSYSRIKDDGSNEKWFETVKRVVEGTFSIQKRWLSYNHLKWNEKKAQKSAQKMYEKMFHMKFLPPGRGLWAMGSPIIEERNLFMGLYSCAFVSTASMSEDPVTPFTYMMDASMLGVGVGFDTKGAKTLEIKRPTIEVKKYIIEDSREGWVDSLRVLLESYFLYKVPTIQFDYSLIRPVGSKIKGFGGTAAGHEILKTCHDMIRELLNKQIGELISERVIVDVMNVIGKCVISGNIRRSSQISIGSADSDEYLDLKNYEINPERAEFGWSSNNSVEAHVGMRYEKIVDRIIINGEPGIMWLDNMRKYSRMNDQPDNKDYRVLGANPCSEISLESYEMCNLVEIFPNHCDNQSDFTETLRCAFLYAKTVTLGKLHWKEANAVMLRNRRIGCSLSGIVQFISNRGVDTFKKWCNEGYDFLKKLDNQLSEIFVVSNSIKITTVKPSGSVSLLAGATPGVHYPESRYYIRRVRVSKYSDLLPNLINAGYNTEPAFGDPETVVVEIPIDSGMGRSVSDVTIWEQLVLASFLQRYWADNQVSCTVTFDPEKEGKDIERALGYFQFQLKSISFLPKINGGAYKQMPYEKIEKYEYEELVGKIRKMEFGNNTNDTEEDKYCSSDHCIIKFETEKARIAAVKEKENIDKITSKLVQSSANSGIWVK